MQDLTICSMCKRMRPLKNRSSHRGRLTSSTKSLPQLWQTISSIFLIFVMKPKIILVISPSEVEYATLTDVENRHGKLNMSKMPRAIRHILITGSTLRGSVDGAESCVR